MAWLAVDSDGKEIIFQFCPKKTETCYIPLYPYSMWIVFPKGSIEKLIGRKLTWKDEPVELKESNF